MITNISRERTEIRCTSYSWPSSEPVALTTAVMVTISPGTQESTRSAVSSHSIVRGMRPASRLSSPEISCTLTVCQSMVWVRGELRRGVNVLPRHSGVGHCAREEYSNHWTIVAPSRAHSQLYNELLKSWNGPGNEVRACVGYYWANLCGRISVYLCI